MKKGSRMMGLINYRLRITLNDGRQFVGQMLAFDKHMNLVVADTEEFRVVKKRRSKE
jgi:small nuclear ribonucleoprotein B and B'